MALTNLFDMLAMGDDAPLEQEIAVSESKEASEERKAYQDKQETRENIADLVFSLIVSKMGLEA